MRNFWRKASQTDEEESVFVTMSDLTISFLLIVMILLAFFATQLMNNANVTIPITEYEELRKEYDEMRTELQSTQEDNENLVAQLRTRLEVYLENTRDQRKNILIEIRNRLLNEFPELDVEISEKEDALHLREALFEIGKAVFLPNKRRYVERIGEILDEILNCYTVGDNVLRDAQCNSENTLVEAVQIEGHTDRIGDDNFNLRLSTNRATETFYAILDRAPRILEYKNQRGESVMSVSGYGEMRPVDPTNTNEINVTDRRIDIRILMYQPTNHADVEAINSQLDNLNTEFTEE